MTSAPPALLSIHDVMPETLKQTDAILQRVAAHGWRPPALLVVPGRDWDSGQITRLRQWQRDGCELLAHGWHHETQPRRPWHRIHAALISRNVAEHLALDPDGIADLMQRSREWFGEAGLATPTAYVPPAWALGMGTGHLALVSYDCVETLGGVHLRGSDGHWLFRRLPLVGFEADTRFRARFLTAMNRLMVSYARRRGLPLRIGIHPGDPELLLADTMEQLLRQDWTALPYAGLQAHSANAAASPF
ncbi:polysaccharide deacetylase family protein [Congregibacter sp.]|uniref:polysaccharide deacetylase family protein n=1 Tax=Congregibacter sp. TaxID=2744308 RepID=UPI003F6D8D35